MTEVRALLPELPTGLRRRLHDRRRPPERGRQSAVLPNLVIRSTRYLCASIGAIARDDDDSSSEHDGHIRDIENAGPQWAKPNVHEVDDLPIGDAIEEVGRATSYEQSHSE